MIDPTNCITTETLRVVEKIREERWAQVKNLHGVIGEHIQRSYVNRHTAEALAEKLHEVEELDHALMVLRAARDEPKGPPPEAEPSGFEIGDRIVQIASDNVIFPCDVVLTVVDAGDCSSMRVRTPLGVEHLVRPSAYGKAPR